MVSIKGVGNRMIHRLTDKDVQVEPYVIHREGQADRVLRRDKHNMFKFNFKYKFDSSNEPTYVSAFLYSRCFTINAADPSANVPVMNGVQNIHIDESADIELEYKLNGEVCRNSCNGLELSEMYKKHLEMFAKSVQKGSSDKNISAKKDFDMSFLVKDFVESDKSIVD